MLEASHERGGASAAEYDPPERRRPAPDFDDAARRAGGSGGAGARRQGGARPVRAGRGRAHDDRTDGQLRGQRDHLSGAQRADPGAGRGQPGTLLFRVAGARQCAHLGGARRRAGELPHRTPWSTVSRCPSTIRAWPSPTLLAASFAAAGTALSTTSLFALGGPRCAPSRTPSTGPCICWAACWCRPAICPPGCSRCLRSSSSTGQRTCRALRSPDR
jgi:hypothetical protein